MDNEFLELCDELLKITYEEKISGNSVLEILKNYCSTISVFDMMAVSAEIIEENKYVQASYREDSQKSYVETFILRVKEILADNNDYRKSIDKEEFADAIKTLMSNHENQTEKSKTKFPLIGCMASIYTTFLLEDPIHKVGTLFPGSLKVEEKDGKDQSNKEEQTITLDKSTSLNQLNSYTTGSYCSYTTNSIGFDYSIFLFARL